MNKEGGKCFTEIEPACLYRAFNEKKYAEQFVEEGIIRLRLLENYKTIEDKNRRDETEGKSSHYIPVEDLCTLHIGEKSHRIIGESHGPGILDFSSDCSNLRIYILCCCGPDVDQKVIKEKFGKYVVRIAAPFQLRDDINNYPNNTNMAIIENCELHKVLYTKGQKEEFNYRYFDSYKSSYLQKYPRFKDENEFRYCVTESRNENPNELIFYNFGKKLDYCEIV